MFKSPRARQHWIRALWVLSGLVVISALFLAWKGVELVRARARQAIASTVGNFSGEWIRFQRLRPYKAFVVSYDQPDGRWVWGTAFEYLTVREAVDMALERCEEGRQREHFSTPCRLYAVNDEIVFDYTDAALQAVFERFRSMEGSEKP